MNKKLFLVVMIFVSVLSFTGIGFAAWGIIGLQNGESNGELIAYNIRNVNEFVDLNTAEHNEDAIENIYYTSDGFIQEDCSMSKTQLTQMSYFVIDTSEFSDGTFVSITFSLNDDADTFISSNNCSLRAVLYDSNKNAIGNPIISSNSRIIVIIEPTAPNTLGSTYYISIQLNMTISNYDSIWYSKLDNNLISMSLHTSINSDASVGWLSMFNTAISYSEPQIVNMSWNYSSPFTYDGTAHTIEFNTFTENIVVTYSGNTQTNAGDSYNAIATLNYNKKYLVYVDGVLVRSGNSCNKNWVINKANPTFVSFSYKAYEGDTISANNSSYVFNGVDSNQISGTFSFAQFTLGSVYGTDKTSATISYPITGTFTPSGIYATNYNTKTQSVNLTVYAVAKNGNTNKYYGNIPTAVSSASSGHAIYVLPGLTNNDNSTIHQIVLNSDLAIDNNKILSLPYEGTTCDWGTAYGDVDTKQTFSSSTDKKTSLKISNGKKLTIAAGSSLYIGGQAGTQGQGTVGLTRGLYAEIVLESASQIEINGTLHNFGFILDEVANSTSLVTINSGANVLMPLTLYDYKGGTNTKGFVESDLFPFSILDFPNIMSRVRYYSGSILKSKLRFKATGAGTRNDDIDILGSNNNYMLFLKSGYLEMKYTPQTFNTPKASAANVPSLDYTQIDLYGELDISKLSMQGYSTESFYLPISYKFHFNVKNSAIINCSYKVKFMSGSVVHIENGGTANINNNVVFYSNNITGTFGTTAYDYPFSTVGNAHLINEGVLNVLSGGGLFGLIEYYSEDDLGIINITNTNLSTSITLDEIIKVSFSGQIFTTDNSTHVNVVETPRAKLRLSDSNISISSLQSRGYYFHHNDHWDGSGCTYSIQYVNIINGSGFDENNINASYSNSISSTIVLSAPTYTTSDFEFAGFYCDSALTNPISTGTVGLSDFGDALDLSTHICMIYVYWVSANIPKAIYRIDKYNGSSAITPGSDVTILVSDTSIVNSFSLDNKEVIFSSSNIKTYTYSGWVAEVYSDSSLNTLIRQDTVINNSYAISENNNIANGYYIIFKPVFIENTYSAPSIQLNLASTLQSGQTATITAVVSNYNTSIFSYTGGFESSDNDQVSVDLTTLQVNVSGTTATYSVNITNAETSGNKSSTESVTIGFGVQLSVLVDGVVYNSGRIYVASGNQSYVYLSCLAPDSLVYMADGTYKMIKDISIGDLVYTWNFFEGKLEIQPVVMWWNHGESLNRVIKLQFENNQIINIVIEHGLFDLDSNKFVFINKDNCYEYIGHSFAFIENGNTNASKLIDVSVIDDEIGSYSLRTAYNDNAIICNAFTLTSEDFEGITTSFIVGDNLTYDQDYLNLLIDTYGLYTYDEWCEYMPEYIFDMFQCKYYKIYVGLGILEVDDFFTLLEGLFENIN